MHSLGYAIKYLDFQLNAWVSNLHITHWIAPGWFQRKSTVTHNDNITPKNIKHTHYTEQKTQINTIFLIKKIFLTLTYLQKKTKFMFLSFLYYVFLHF